MDPIVPVNHQTAESYQTKKKPQGRPGLEKRKAGPKCSYSDLIGSFHVIRTGENNAIEHLRQEHISALSKHGVLRAPQSSPSSLLAMELVDRISTASHPGLQLTALGDFIVRLAPRIGDDPSLDASIKCLLQGHRRILCRGSRDPKDLSTDLDNYISALWLLRTDLAIFEANPNKSPSIIVCAAMILSRYEMLRDDDATRAFIAQAGGASSLIQAWGPKRIVSAFDLELFATHYGTVVLGSVFSGNDCFLLDAEWSELKIRCRSLMERDRSSRLTFDILTILSTLPPLLRDTRSLVSPSRCSNNMTVPAEAMFRAQEFKSRLMEVSSQLKQDLQDHETISQRPAAEGREFLQYEYHFRDSRVAAYFGMFWAARIISERILQRLESLQYHDAREMNCRENKAQGFALDILRSVGFLLDFAPFGALHMSFALRVVCGVIEAPETREWARWALMKLVAPLTYTYDLDHMTMIGKILTGMSYEEAASIKPQRKSRPENQ